MSADSDDVQDNATRPEQSNEPPSKHRQPKWAWWVIGILIPTLAIVVPVLVTVWPSSSDTDASGNSVSPSAFTSSSAGKQATASPSTEAPAPSASLSSPANAIQWTGQVRITDDDLYLDERPPERVPGGSGDVDLALVNPPRLSSSFEPDLALWPEKTMPTRRECSDLVSTQGVKRVEATVGAVICVRTMEGRAAVLTITSTSNSFNTGVTAQATVWSEISG